MVLSYFCFLNKIDFKYRYYRTALTTMMFIFKELNTNNRKVNQLELVENENSTT